MPAVDAPRPLRRPVPLGPASAKALELATRRSERDAQRLNVILNDLERLVRYQRVCARNGHGYDVTLEELVKAYADAAERIEGQGLDR